MSASKAPPTDRIEDPGAVPAASPASPASPSSTPPARTPSGTGARPVGLSRWTAPVLGFLRGDDRWIRALIAVASAALYTWILYHWAQGALLYGADNSGIYAAGNFLATPRVDSIIPSITILLIPHSTSGAMYAAIAVNAFISSYACQFFARNLFRRSFHGVRLLAVGAIAANLYVYSPVNITYWYVELLAIVFLSTSALFVVLGFLVILLKSFSSGTPFTWKHAAMLGIALGFSCPNSFPNDVRVVGLTAVLFLCATLWGIFHTWPNLRLRRSVFRGLKRIALLSLPIAALLLFYPFYNFLTSGGFNLATIGNVASVYSVRFSNTPYNDILKTLRLLGRQSFNNSIYYGAWMNDPWTRTLSFIWPVFALGVPLAATLVWKFPDRWLVLGLEAICYPAVLWETGSNPPTGAIHDLIIQVLPFGNTLLQTYSLTLILLSKIFPVLVAFSIVTLGGLLGQVVQAVVHPSGGMIESLQEVAAPPFDYRRLRWRRAPALASFVTIALLTIVAASVATPIFNGAAEQTTWPPTCTRTIFATQNNFACVGQHGYFIPSDYYTVRSYLRNTPSAGVLLLPAIGTYFRTNWGINTANGFYADFYYPNTMVVPRFYGQYSLFVNSTSENYTRATNPLIPSGLPSAPLNTQIHPPRPIALGMGGIWDSFVVSPSLNVTGATWLRVQIGYSNFSTVQTALQLGLLWLGLADATATDTTTANVAWYVLGSSSSAYVESIANGTITADLLLDSPTMGSPPHDGIVVAIRAEVRIPVQTFGLLYTPTNLTLVNQSAIDSGWRPIMHAYGVTYILVDHTIIGGLQQPLPLVNETISQLVAEGLAYDTLETPDLSLYLLAPYAP